MANGLPGVQDLLPHTGSAILVDELLSETTAGVTAAAHIRREHPFFSAAAGGVPSWVGIELMAQTIALHAGLVGHKQGQPPRIGYLLGTRRYTPTTPCFPSGAQLEIAVEKLFQDDSGLGAYQCSIRCDGLELVSANVSVFQTDDERRT